MKLIRLAVYLSIGFICSSLLIFFFGQGGLRSFADLKFYHDRLAENIIQLDKINGRHLENLEALRSDPQQIVLMARELGYFQEGERVIRIEGYRPTSGYHTVGTLLSRDTVKTDRDWIFKLLGLCLPLVLYTVSFIWRKRRDHQQP